MHVLSADHSRSKLQKTEGMRPVGAYNTVQPLNLSSERARFLAEAEEYESGRTSRPPTDPVFEYADMEDCNHACPTVPCTCARAKLWHEYGERACVQCFSLRVCVCVCVFVHAHIAIQVK
jgi:hypothetical protein